MISSQRRLSTTGCFDRKKSLKIGHDSALSMSFCTTVINKNLRLGLSVPRVGMDKIPKVQCTRVKISIQTAALVACQKNHLFFSNYWALCVGRMKLFG